MNHKRPDQRSAPLFWRGIGLGLLLLGTALLGSSALLGRDKVPQPEPDKSALAAVQMIVRGPDEPMVGQRCTVEVFLLNSGTTALKDLALHAKFDAHMEQDSKERETTVAVEAIAPNDVQVVRLNVTPRKVGPGGIDFALRAKNGATEQVRQVWPVLPEGANKPVKAQPLLKFKITTLRECFVDRPSIVLVNVVNTDAKPMRERLALQVSYGSMGGGGQVLAEPQQFQPDVQKGGLGGPLQFGGRMRASVSTNPTRQTQVTLPILGAGESRTLPIRVTPRRGGDLGIAITAVPSKTGAAPQTLATTRLRVKFDPSMSAEQLVPVRANVALPTRLPGTLAEVPEVALEDPCPQTLKGEEAFEHVGGLIEKINHVNATRPDAFVVALASKRADVRGLPFVMGDACRLSAERGQNFQAQLSVLRAAMTNPTNLANQMVRQPPGATDSAMKARIAAVVQVLAPEGAQANQQEVKYLATLTHNDATRALARFAIFTEDEQVRSAALAALSTRKEKDVADILVDGLHYPWPAVAQHAADAIVKLKRQDLLPQLVEMLDRPDPRAPQLREKAGKQVPVVRELVRINHLRNCLLCHSPMNPAKAVALPSEQTDELRLRARGLPVATALTAPVPLPNQQLPTPTPQGGYGQFTVPDILVSFDVTYLRQDFSRKLPVPAAQPWPELQRFDFLVRTRELTEKEADAQRALLRSAQDGKLSPYQRTALASLRQWTGRDAEPTAAAWRKLLAEK